MQYLIIPTGIVALYLTLLLYKFNVFQTIGQGCLICLYWFVLLYAIFRFIKKNLSHYTVRIYSLYVTAFILASISLVFGGDLFLLRFKQDTLIEVVATGEKNREAESDEVRISGIKTDGIWINLGNIPLSDGWDYLPDSNMLVAYPNEKESIQLINLGKVENISITFVRHPWSGNVIVNAKDHSYDIDLYNPEASIYVYETEGDMYHKKWLDLISFLIAWIILFFVYLELVCLCCKNEKYLVLIQLIFTVLLIDGFKEIIGISSKTLLCILIGYSILGGAGLKWYFKHDKKTAKTILFLITVLITYWIIGKEIFINEKNILLQFVKFLGAVIWMLPCLAFIMKSLDGVWRWLKPK